MFFLTADSITASQQRVMRFKSEAGADDLSNSVQRQPVVPPIVFLPLADPVPIRPQSSPARDQNTLNNNLLMTNIKVSICCSTSQPSLYCFY